MSAHLLLISSNFFPALFIEHIENVMNISGRIFKIYNLAVPVVAQWLTNLTGNHEVVGSIPGIAQWVKDLALP